MDKFYLTDYQGKADTRSFPINESGFRLPDVSCKFVRISNFNVENLATMPVEFPRESSAKQGGEILYGFGGSPAFQIFPGAATDLIPVANLNQITLQSRPGETRQAWVTYFW
jgi:hypothetical protein